MTARLAAVSSWCIVMIALAVWFPPGWPWALIAILAGTYALIRWPDSARAGLEPTVRTIFFLPVLVGVLVPSVVGIVTVGQFVLTNLSRVEPHGAWPLVSQVVLVIAGCLAVAVFWPGRWPLWSFPLAATTAALGVRLAFVVMVHVEPTSDFAGMWTMTEQVAEDGLGVITHSDDHIDRFHFQRTIPYLLPLRMAFGSSRWAYVLANSVLTIGSSLLTWWLARRFFGPRSGRVALTLSLLAIEPVLVAGIPSHDNPGAFFTLVALIGALGLVRAATERGCRAPLACGVGMGLLLTVLDLQRNNRLFLLAALLLFLVGWAVLGPMFAERGRERWLTVVRVFGFSLVVPFLVTTVADSALRATGLLMPRTLVNAWKYRAIAAHTDSWSSGRYAYAVDQYYQRFHLDQEVWRDIGWRKLITDTLRSPEARLAFYIRKAERMFDLGSQLSFYLPKDSRDRSGEQISRVFRRDLLLANRAYVVIFLFLIIAGMITSWRDHSLSAPCFLPAIYLGISIMAFLLFFQPQPRYAFQIWYIGSIYISSLVRESSGATS